MQEFRNNGNSYILKTVFIIVFTFLSMFYFVNLSLASTLFDKLKKGEVIVEDNVSNEAKSGSAKMTFFIHDTPERIWKLLVEYDRWTTFMPDLEKIVIKESKPEYAIVYVKAKAPLGLDIHYVLKRVYNKKDYKITWHMVEGKAKEVEGSWQITPLENKVSKVVYINYVDLGFMVPPKVISMLTKGKLPNLAEGMRAYLRKNRNF